MVENGNHDGAFLKEIEADFFRVSGIGKAVLNFRTGQLLWIFF